MSSSCVVHSPREVLHLLLSDCEATSKEGFLSICYLCLEFYVLHDMLITCFEVICLVGWLLQGGGHLHCCHIFLIALTLGSKVWLSICDCTQVRAC